MASQSQGTTVGVTSSGVATAATTANGPPLTSAPSPTPAVLASAAAKTQALPASAQPSQSQQQQANNIEPLDKSSSNTLKVCSFDA